jgi:CubicO group peptidase (beta-lactamase class C family)
MTSFLMGLAQEQGYLNINDSVSHFLGSGWTACSPVQEGAITIRNQLTMTTGFDDFYGGVTVENHCTSDSCLVCLAVPGSRWAYHNAPYTLTHSVLDSATQMSVNAFKNQNLLSRTGISGQFYPSGYDDVYISKARAFARFGLLVSNRGIWDTDTIMHDTSYYNQMINTSQAINLSYGYLWWLNGKSSYHLPGTQFQFNGPLIPHAPSDVIAALGKNDQFLNIAPGLGIIMIRMGDPMFGVNEIPNFSNDSIWVRLNEVLCNTVDIDEKRI